jgi:beta-N-acetylhexosaminidase
MTANIFINLVFFTGRTRGEHAPIMRFFLSGLLILLISCTAFTPGRAETESMENRAGNQELDLWIGQMLMVGFRGTELNEGDPFLEVVRDFHLGGVILFDYDVPAQAPVRNISSSLQLSRLTTQLQAAARVPLLIAIDQEGGRVARLKEKHGFPATLSAAELGLRNEESLTRSSAREIANTLVELGINLNFAPVLDLASNPENPIIAALGRSYGPDSDQVLRHGRWTIEEFHKKGLLSAVKHFPGHGSSRDDSHLGLPDVTLQWNPGELEPFRRLIQEQLPDLVMTAHLFNSNWDREYPATLSREVVNTMLREDLGFGGVIISDDMQMGAIVENYTLEKGIQRAVEAGIDILLFANNSSYDPEIASRAFNILRDLVNRGALSPDRIQESYLRILKLKENLIK